MIVEDENLLLQAISKKLQLNNFETVTCISGHQAIDYLENLDSLVELPDFIWLDFYLKDMNGLTFMSKLKENPKWQKIPVIVISNSASPDKVESMMTLGAKEYLVKAEHRLDEIIVIIRDMLDKTE